MSDSTIRNQAEYRVSNGFYAHLFAYVAVCGGLAAMNLTRQPQRPWFLWVVAGWGIGISLHAVATYVPQLRERTVDRLAQRLARRSERRERRGKWTPHEFGMETGPPIENGKGRHETLQTKRIACR